METLEHCQSLVKPGIKIHPELLNIFHSSPHIYSLFNTYVLKSLKISHTHPLLSIFTAITPVQVRLSISTITAILSVPLILFLTTFNSALSQGASCIGRQKRKQIHNWLFLIQRLFANSRGNVWWRENCIEVENF